MITNWIVVLGLAFQGTGNIDTQLEDSWQRSSVTFSFDMNGEKTRSMAIPTVFTQREDISGTFFMCDASSYRVRIAEKPMPMYMVAHGTQKRNVPRVTFKLYIEGEQVHKGEADLWKELDAIAPLGREPAAILYNAIVQGQSASYKLNFRREPLPIHLPAVDEHFVSFAQACQELQSGG